MIINNQLFTFNLGLSSLAFSLRGRRGRRAVITDNGFQVKRPGNVFIIYVWLRPFKYLWQVRGRKEHTYGFTGGLS